MDGQPVWLCSVSHTDRRGSIIATGDWTAYDFELAELLARAQLYGVGDESRERAFRMNITFCVHRAVSEAEKAKLPCEWSGAPGGLAGGPVQVLWSRGIEHKLAAMPCENPKRLILYASRPDLWVPDDCGTCGPCIARSKIEAEIKSA